MDESAASSARPRKTVLIVDDDPGTLHVLANGIENVLDMFDVVTAANGREAIEILEQQPIDALVTDLSMPVMDGFALLGYITKRQQVVPVVVLSGMASSEVDERLARYGGLRVLPKPASYQAVAESVLGVVEATERGHVEGIPLTGVLQLVESERRSCTVVVASGRRKGRLYFESGRLINAFSEDFGADGEAAAYDILGWSDAAIGFEDLPDDVRRQIHTPMQLMLIEVAVAQDQLRERTERSIPPPPPNGRLSGAEAAAHDGALGAEDADPASPDPDETEVPPDAPPDAPPYGGPQADQLASPASGAEVHGPDEPLAEPEATAVSDEPIGSIGETLSAEPLAATDDLTDDLADDVTDELADDVTDAPDDTDEWRDAEPTAATDDLDPEPPTEEPAPERPLGEPLPVTPTSGVALPATTPPSGVTPEPRSDTHVTGLLEAVERLTQRARDANAALAAVETEIEAFRQAQRQFDAVNEHRERRHRELEAFRNDVAQMARELLGRVDELFEPTSPVETDEPEDGEPPQPAP